MKRQLLGVAAILLSISTYAQDNPLWMRYCAISPDGTTIAFTYKGDIYTVPSTGGRASQITTNPAHDTKPIWSPDGKKIAFASDRMGSMDIFEVNKEGGIPKRLTTHSGNETPVAYKDAGHILFLANIMPTAEDAQFPSGQFQQVYEVNTEGGRPILFSSMPMEDISINHTGNTLLYHDKKGYEDPWRKHHTSSITRDIWLCSLNGNRTFRKQTAFNGAYLPMLDLLKAVDGRIPNFAGIKYTFESLYEYNQCRLYKNGKYDMLHGQDETILPSLAQGGAQGGIGGTTNYNGKELVGIIEAWKNGDIEIAREKQNFAQEVINVICHYRGNIVGGKRIMKLMGFDLGPNRTPFRNMTDEEEQAMKKELEAINFFERCNQF